MERGSDRFFRELLDPAEMEGDPLARFDAWFAQNRQIVSTVPEFLRLHLALSLTERRDPLVQQITDRVRETALERLTSAMALLFGDDPSHGGERARRYALMLLALVDGSIIAEQFGRGTLPLVLDDFRQLLALAV
jgi:hypothetical protein